MKYFSTAILIFIFVSLFSGLGVAVYSLFHTVKAERSHDYRNRSEYL